MFLVFGSEENTNLLFMGVIAGVKAKQLNDWLNDVPGLPNPLPITHIPIMRFLSNMVHDHQTASWEGIATSNSLKYSRDEFKTIKTPTR